jgi:hypothetical protein
MTNTPSSTDTPLTGTAGSVLLNIMPEPTIWTHIGPRITHRPSRLTFGPLEEPIIILKPEEYVFGTPLTPAELESKD